MLPTVFASPGFLFALAAVPIAATFLLYARWRRRRAQAMLGGPVHLRKALLVRQGVRRGKTVALLVALMLIGLACAAPQWGRDPEAPRRVGRDVVLVLDLSRSMSAEQPSRRELALRALDQLANAFEADGGNRVALVVFASRAELLFPLTQDYDHLRQVLARIAAQDYPSLRDPASPSGTRIGVALQAAIESFQPGRGNRPIAILLSDGDDPDDDGKEWLAGAALARAKRIRVHTVGIGDPVEPHTIPAGRDILHYDGKPVQTKLHENRLRDIAEQTGGAYLPARRAGQYPLGDYVRVLLDSEALQEEYSGEQALPTLQQRYAWFLWPAVVLLMLTMLMNEGPRAMKNPEQPPSRFGRHASGATKAMLATLAIACVSAAASERVESLLRQADAAFAHERFADALRLYEDAEVKTLDPGRIAFNKAAAYLKLQRYREAVESYRRCLEDDQIAAERRARAQFGLGTALVRHAGDDAATLAQAAAAYRACLQQPDLDPQLRDDARHNLEIVQQLWLRAKPKLPETKENTQPPPKKQPTDDSAWTPVEPKKGQHMEHDSTAPAQKSDKLQSEGVPQTLRDDEKVQAITRANTEATLRAAAERIAERRRQQRHPDWPASVSTKDW